MDQLELANALAKLLAVVNIGDHFVQAGLHDPYRPSREYGALKIQARHQDSHAFALTLQDVLPRHLHVFEHQFAGV